MLLYPEHKETVVKKMDNLSQSQLDAILSQKIQVFENGDFEASRLIFKDLNLSGLNFREFKTVKADFVNVNLSGTNLSKVFLEQSKFISVNFTEAILEEASLDQSQISDCNLSYSKLCKANLNSLRAYRSYFMSVDGLGASLIKADFQDCNFQEANFEESIAARSSFIRSFLQRSIFCNADLRVSQFINSDLRFCNLSNANISKSKFIESMLFGFNIKGAITTNSIGMKVDLSPQGDASNMIEELFFET